MADTSSASTGSGRVLVFGASGGAGRHVVEQALGRGQEVIAVVRTPGKLAVGDPKLTAVTAELSNREAIDAAVRGADAVIGARPPRNRDAARAGDAEHRRRDGSRPRAPFRGHRDAEPA